MNFRKQGCRIGIITGLVFLATCCVAAPQDSTVRKQSLTGRQKLIIVGIAVQQLGSAYLEYKWWWEGDYHPLVLESDGWLNNYSLMIDKAGHFYTSYFFFNGVNEIMKWGRFSKKARVITSLSLPALYAFSIEMGDGFTSYNFSPADLLANTAGIGFGVLREYVPFLQNFNCKYSYYPSPDYIDNHFKNWSMVEDYNGHIYWLTANIAGMMGGAVQQKAWKYFNLGLGYGVQLGPNQGRQFFIGLDYNLSAIKVKGEFNQSALRIVDMFHLPAPGVKSHNGKQTLEWYMR